AVEQSAARFVEAHAFALPARIHELRVRLTLGRRRRILDRDLVEWNVHRVRFGLDRFAITKENGERDAFLDADARRTNDFRLFAFGEDDALRVADGAIHQPAHDAARTAQPHLEPFTIVVEIDEVVRRARGDRRPRDRRRNPQQHARIEREGNEILGAEAHVLKTVQRRDRVRHVLLGEQRECTRRRHLHLFIDFGRADIQRAAENEREAEDVVDLIGIVAASRRDDRVVPHRAYFFRQNFRNGIRQREDDRMLGHRLDHLARDGAGNREADEHVGADERVLDRARVRFILKARLVRVHVIVATLEDDALPVAHDDVLALHAQADVVLRRRDGGGAGAGEHDANVLDLLADDLDGVDTRRAGDDRGAMLIVMEDGNLHRLPERLFDVEAVGRLDVLEVDAANRGLEELTKFYHVVGILGAYLEIEHVEVGELLEEIPFAFHHRLAGHRADV